MAAIKNVIHVKELVPVLSATYPARVAPTALPISKDMDKYADSDAVTVTVQSNINKITFVFIF